MTYEIITSLIGGIITLFVGVLVTILNAKLTRQKEIEKEKLTEVVAASAARAEAAKIELIESLTKRLPENVSPDEVISQLSAQYKIGGDVIINQVVKEGSGLIEDLVNGYHQQALSQARVQFWFSVAAATVGFIYILYSADTTTSSTSDVVLKILPGLIIDAVALLFFRQAEQTRQRATELYDRLRADSQMHLAQSTLEKIEDTKIRSLAQAQIALHLSGLTPKDIDLASLLAHVKQPA